MKTIYLVRHGESESNVADTFMGSEAPLTALGREQAQRIAQRATRLTIDALIASPLARTQETAGMIREATGHEIEYSDLFKERILPASIIGRPKSDPKAWATSDAAIRSSEGYGEKVEDTETFVELVERAQQAISFLESHPAKDILVVGHGFFTRVLIARMLFGEALTPEVFAPFVWGIRTRNTGLSVLKCDPADKHRPWWMLVWNDHAHLG